MSDKPWLRRHWKLVLNLTTLAALVLVIYLSRHETAATIKNLAHVHAWVLLGLIPIEIINYHAQAKLYQRLFAMVGNKLSYKFLFKASLELNFVNHVFPSGGATGLSYFTVRMRKGKELSSGKVTLIHLMKLLLYVLSFEIVLVIGVFCLAVMGRVNGLVILVAGSLSTLLVVGTASFGYVVGSRRRINGLFTGLTRLLNRLIRIVRPRSPETISIEAVRHLFDDFHDNYREIVGRYKELGGPFWYAFLANVSEVAAVYIVYVAFGKLVNVGAVILAYAIANFAGLVSVLPGGVGIYEALMTISLASTGVPPGVSLPVTIMYRVANTLIQIPPGYYLYQQTLRRGQPPPGEPGA